MTLTGDPHLLSLRLMESGEVDFSIECPYENKGGELPCVMWEECMGKHSEPREPECDEPQYVLDEGTSEKIYGSDSSMEAIEAWASFYAACDEYEETHSSGFHATDECWLKVTVAAFNLNDQWELKGFDNQLVVGPVPVDWDNAGSLDDSYLVIMPYVPKESDADGEEIHHPTDVGSA